jgi:putative FmdB family regulatory protein
MPTYPYRCKACGYEFEEFQSITEDPLESCPRCGSELVRIISGGGGFLFKGSGFYITDYRKESYKKAAAKDKPSSTESGSSTGKSASKSSSDSSKATK